MGLTGGRVGEGAFCGVSASGAPTSPAVPLEPIGLLVPASGETRVVIVRPGMKPIGRVHDCAQKDMSVCESAPFLMLEDREKKKGGGEEEGPGRGSTATINQSGATSVNG